MCMMSAVFDQWRPAFPPAHHPVYPWPTPAPDLVDAQERLVDDAQKRYSVDDLGALIDAFQAALDAAKRYDEITGQPDCADPDKAKLLERVADLERRLREVEERPASSTA